MKQQTPIQELISELENIKIASEELELDEEITKAVVTIIKIAKSKLPKEKMIICIAYNNGKIEGITNGSIQSQQYFEENYGE